MTNFICLLNINTRYLQSEEVKKKNGMRSTCSVKVGTDDENTNVHLVFFFLACV